MTVGWKIHRNGESRYQLQTLVKFSVSLSWWAIADLTHVLFNFSAENNPKKCRGSDNSPVLLRKKKYPKIFRNKWTGHNVQSKHQTKFLNAPFIPKHSLNASANRRSPVKTSELGADQETRNENPLRNSFFPRLIWRDELHESCTRISEEARVINCPTPAKEKHERALIDRSIGQRKPRRRRKETEKTLMSANSRFSVFAISVLDRLRKNRSSITKGRPLSWLR